jgi:hypothetical protein
MSGKIPVISTFNLKRKITTNNIPLSVAFLTRDLSDPAFARKLIRNGASYQVIPSTHQPVLYNAGKILAELLPLSK